MNLTILDCETEESARRHAAEFEKRRLYPWSVLTSRGLHFWWLSADGEIANVDSSRMGDEAEIRGNMRYCVVPPSIHPTGMIYEWVSRESDLPPMLPISALDWLPLQLAIKARKKPTYREDDPLSCLSIRNREFIRSGAPVGTRNNRLFAAACDLSGNGFNHEEAVSILMPILSTWEASEQHKAHDSIRSAYSEEREPAKQSHTHAPSIPSWTRVAEWCKAHRLTRLETTITKRDGKEKRIAVSASTVRAVMLALCERARRDDAREDSPFRASVREVSELANIGRNTAYRALACIVDDGLIVRCGQSKMGAGLYAWSKDLLHDGDSTSHRSVSSVTMLQQNSDAFRDAFARGALNGSGELVWRTILGQALRPTEISRCTRLSQSTVSRALAKLADFQLAEKVGRAWIGNGASEADFVDIAAKCGTLGRAQARRERHEAERARHVTSLILFAKRKWERTNLWRLPA